MVTRITRIGAAVILLGTLIAPAARAHHAPPYPSGPLHEWGEMLAYPMVFPLVGTNSFSNTFYSPRCCDPGEIHHATDIMSPKMTPVVAVAPGVVRSVNWSHNPNSIDPTRCCTIAIEHDDGMETWYIHLNNDTPGTDDGRGWGIADGILPGVRVAAGQLIGWVGDSGNAENTSPHLHFELMDAYGVRVNPYAALVAAKMTTGEPLCPEGAVCDTATFVDSGGRWHRWDTLKVGAAVSTFYFGNPGDVAFTGDWDCDGERTPGLYRQSDGYVYLRQTNTQGFADITFFFGNPGDVPIVGDFDGDDCDTVSIYRPSEGRFYIINQLGENDGGLGTADYDFVFGNPYDQPFVGDFDGDGVDTVGLYRVSSGYVYFRNTNNSGFADLAFYYGDPGDIILAGDWDGDGDDTVAVYRPGTGMLHMLVENRAGVADYAFSVGRFARASVT